MYNGPRTVLTPEERGERKRREGEREREHENNTVP